MPIDWNEESRRAERALWLAKKLDVIVSYEPISNGHLLFARPADDAIGPTLPYPPPECRDMEKMWPFHNKLMDMAATDGFDFRRLNDASMGAEGQVRLFVVQLGKTAYPGKPGWSSSVMSENLADATIGAYMEAERMRSALGGK